MASFKEITVDQAHDLMGSKDALVVDIRDPGTYQAGHIPKAISINPTNVDDFIKKYSKDKPLICYCYHGFSSQQAAQFFSQRGFQEVYSMQGGFEAWKSVYPNG